MRPLPALDRFDQHWVASCYFLLNYAQGTCTRCPNLVRHGFTYLLFSFELCEILQITAELEKLKEEHLLFSFELCEGEAEPVRPIADYGDVDLLFSFELCPTTERPSAISSATLSTISVNLLFSFELCLSSGAGENSNTLLLALLFSFELCATSHMNIFGHPSDKLSCYFLLNYASYRVSSVSVAGSCRACYFLLNYACGSCWPAVSLQDARNLLFSFELCSRRNTWPKRLLVRSF